MCLLDKIRKMDYTVEELKSYQKIDTNDNQ